jgi:hypothetical protein
MKEGTRHLLEKAERAIQAADILLSAVGAESVLRVLPSRI